MTIRSVLRRWALVATLAVLAVGGLALFSAGPARAEEGANARSASTRRRRPATSRAPSPRWKRRRSINGKKLALQLLNFGVLLFILIKFGGPAINKALAARHQQLKADLASAAAARAEAEARLAQQEKRLGALEQEIAAMRAGVKAEAEAEKARLIALAEERAKRHQRGDQLRARSAGQGGRGAPAPRGGRWPPSICRADGAPVDGRAPISSAWSTAFVSDVAGRPDRRRRGREEAA